MLDCWKAWLVAKDTSRQRYFTRVPFYAVHVLCSALILCSVAQIVHCRFALTGSDGDSLSHRFFFIFYHFNEEKRQHIRHYSTHQPKMHHNLNVWLKCASVVRSTLASEWILTLAIGLMSLFHFYCITNMVFTELCEVSDVPHSNFGLLCIHE